MLRSLDHLRELSAISVLLRLGAAMFLGGLIGWNRGRKRRAAGFRTYMLVSLGAALTMVLGEYNVACVETIWELSAAQQAIHTDVSRIGAQVINGIGFLGAGTILVTSRGEVKGFTTAAGLWASACMGLAIGAGFFECVFLAFVLIILSLRILAWFEEIIIKKAKNMNIHIQFLSLDDIGDIIAHIKQQNIHIYEVEINRRQDDSSHYPSAVFTIRLSKREPHAHVLARISEAKSVFSIEEI